MLSPSNPSFSVVIPTYQRREVVRAAVQALCAVRYAGPMELIVVIDGSTDGTAEALAAVSCPFPSRIVEQDNQGASAARNRGAAEASGEIILFLDDDMISQPDLLDQHARMYRDGADAVTGAVFLDPGSPRSFLTDSVEQWISRPRPAAADLPFHIYTGHLSARRSAFEAIGGFDEGFTSGETFGHEDTDFGVKLLADYDVRHNREAVTRQRYVVGPRETMKRAARTAAADLRFLTRYPKYVDHIFDQRGRSQWRTRLIYWPVSRIPFLPQLLSSAAVWLAEQALESRFRSNRLLRYFFFAARAVRYWSAIWARGGIPASHSLLVLCYHAIEDRSQDPVLAPYSVPPELLNDHIKALSIRGFVFIGPEALAMYLRDGAPLPSRSVLLTIDDCYQDLRTAACRQLRPNGVEAVAFAVTGAASGTNEWDQPHGAGRIHLLGPTDLHELTKLGIEIGAHSRSHRPMPGLGLDECRDETIGARADLAANGLPPPRYFAYPYGACNEQAIEAVKDAGYLAAFGVQMRLVDRSSDHFCLPRVPIGASDRGWRFQLKCSHPRLFEWVDRLSRRALKVIGFEAPPRLA